MGRLTFADFQKEQAAGTPAPATPGVATAPTYDSAYFDSLNARTPAETAPKPLLGQEDPTAAAIRLTKEKLSAPKHPVLSFLANAVTGSTQKFADTLGSAASTDTTSGKILRGVLPHQLGAPNGSATDLQNEASIHEAESRLKLAQILKTASPEQAVRIRKLLAQGADVGTATDVNPTLMKTPEQVVGEGLGTGLEALSGGTLAGVGAPAKTIGQAVVKGAVTGGVYGLLSGTSQGMQANKSAGGVALSAGVGGATGGVLGAGLGAATFKLGEVLQASAAEKAKALVGKATQETGDGLDRAVKAVAALDPEDLKMVNNDYEKLTGVTQTRIDALKQGVDLEMAQVPDPVPLKSFNKSLPAGKGMVVDNPVTRSLSQLEELYTKTDNPEMLAKVKNFQELAQTDGLTAADINDLARKYGSEFKSFNPNTGNPPTSVTKIGYENTRSALKDAARALLPTDKAKLMDEQMGNLIALQDASASMEDSVQKLSNKMNQRGILSKLGDLAGKVADTGGFLKHFLGQIMPIQKGPEVMDATAIQSQLSKNLIQANKLLNMGDNELVRFISRHAQDFLKQATPVITQTIGGGVADLTTGN